MDMFCGKRIIINEGITKTVQCRTHKKKRINKKWLKRYGCKRVADNSKIYTINDYIFMTQKCFDRVSHLVEHYERI